MPRQCAHWLAMTAFLTISRRAASSGAPSDLCRIESLQETDSQRKGLAAATATASIAAIVAEEKNQDDPKAAVVIVTTSVSIK